MSLQMAFEITVDDVKNVVDSKKIDLKGKTVEEIHDELDLDEVSAAALDGGVDMDDQTDAAYEKLAEMIPNVIEKLEED